MADTFWDDEQSIAELKKNDRGEVISVKLVAKNGRQFVDVRNFYINKEGEYAPGKGIALPMNMAAEIATHILAAVERSGNQ